MVDLPVPSAQTTALLRLLPGPGKNCTRGPVTKGQHWLQRGYSGATGQLQRGYSGALQWSISTCHVVLMMSRTLVESHVLLPPAFNTQSYKVFFR